MKLKKVFLFIITIFGIGIISILDKVDRSIIFSHQPKFENEDIKIQPDLSVEELYKTHFGKLKYKFPRKNTALIKLYKNKYLISRIFSKTVESKLNSELITFFNNPENFNWSETTWTIDESEYILRFFDSEEKEIGKVFLCLENCGITKSLPFSPNMKFGGLSKKGMTKIKKLITKIEGN